MPQVEESKSSSATMAAVSPPKTRPHDTASISGSSSTSDDSTKRRRRNRDRKNGKRQGAPSNQDVAGVKNGQRFAKRSNSLGKAARDPRDEPPTKKRPQLSDGGSGNGGAEASPKEPSSMIDYDGLSRPSRGTRERREESTEAAQERFTKMQGAVRTILECIGEDPDREGLLDTPSRYAKALMFLTKGYQENVEDIVNNALFHEGHNEMVIVKDIEIYSLCEHHMVPFTGKMHIGYIPSNTVIGLSKLPRIAELFARRLQVQERLTKEVAQAVMEILKPQGVAVVMESSHLCMVMRGVQQTSTSTITSCVLGCFERKSKTRNEFLSLIGVSKSGR